MLKSVLGYWENKNKNKNELLVKGPIVFTADVFITLLNPFGFMIWALCFSQAGNLFTETVYHSDLSFHSVKGNQ